MSSPAGTLLLQPPAAGTELARRPAQKPAKHWEPREGGAASQASTDGPHCTDLRGSDALSLERAQVTGVQGRGHGGRGNAQLGSLLHRPLACRPGRGAWGAHAGRKKGSARACGDGAGGGPGAERRTHVCGAGHWWVRHINQEPTLTACTHPDGSIAVVTRAPPLPILGGPSPARAWPPLRPSILRPHPCPLTRSGPRSCRPGIRPPGRPACP